MAYNIVALTGRFSSSPNDAPLVADWSFNPTARQTIHYVQGSAIPPPMVIETVIKNYHLTGNFTSVIVRAELVYSNSNKVWSELTGEIKSATPASPIGQFDKSGYDITTGLAVTNTLTFKDFSVLISGRYMSHIDFKIYESGPSLQQLKLIDNVKFYLDLVVSGSNEIQADKNELFFSHLRNSPLPLPQTVNVTELSSWYVSVDKRISISIPGGIDNSNAASNIIAAAGNKAMVVGLSSQINSYQGSLFQTQLILTNSKGLTKTINVKVTIFESDSFTVSPSKLAFKATKGFTEAAAQTLSVSGFGAFNITAPSWLILSSAAGVNSANIIVTPISANNLSSNTYIGEIVITGISGTYKVPVEYVVEGLVSTSFDDGNFNFAKDNEYLKVTNGDRNFDNIVKVALNIKSYNHVDFSEKESVIDYVWPFFNNEASEHIGSIIERFFSKPNDIKNYGFETLDNEIFRTEPIFKPTLVDADIKIVNRTTSGVVYEELLREMMVLPGKKPDNFLNNGCILSSHTSVKRVTKRSNEIVNFLVPEGVFKLSITKNNEEPHEIASINAGTHNVFRTIFNFSNYEAGDLVSFNVTVDGKTYSKIYELLPEGKQSYHVAYVNQYNLLELFEFTGDILMASDIKPISHTYYRNYVEVVENLESTKSISAGINTGHIFRDDQIVVDDILRSRIGWLVFRDKPAIELVPKEKKLTFYDSDQELYSYDLEFNVNRKHDVENYTF